MGTVLFTSENSNTTRQNEIDWARGLAVFFMVLKHAQTMLAYFPEDALYTQIISFIGGPLAAPVFMMLLGVGIVYSRRRNPKMLAVRGVTLLGIHYALNFFAFGLPTLIARLRTGDSAYQEYFWEHTFNIDILAFAGLTFLFFALVEKFKLQVRHILLVGLVLACVNLVTAVPVDNFAAGAVLGLFAYVNELAFFAFLPWISYPIMGYAFGKLLIRCTDKRFFYKYAAAFSVLIIAALSLGAHKYGFDIWTMHIGNLDAYWHQDFIQNILVGSICVLWLSIMYAVSHGAAKMKIGIAINKLFSRWSGNVTGIYVTQFVIYGWLIIPAIATIYFPANWLFNLVAGIIVFILSDVIAWLYLSAKRKRKSKG